MPRTFTSKEALARVKSVNRDDVIIFTIDGKKLHYRSIGNFLNYENGSNSHIFSILKINKYDLCKRVYGREPGKGDFPEFYAKPGELDGEGMRLIAMALYDEIERLRGKNADAICTLEDLLACNGELRMDQILYCAGYKFVVKPTFFRLVGFEDVERNHSDGMINELMTKLDISREELFAAYGSKAREDGTWPPYPEHDYKAAWRGALVLFTKELLARQKSAPVTEEEIIRDAEWAIGHIQALIDDNRKKATKLERERTMLVRETFALRKAIAQSRDAIANGGKW